MRLWSLHPSYLDRAGLTACWREGLLAKKVLEGGTRGYRNHPQLERFKQTVEPLTAINAYLHCVADEAGRRGYVFDRTKLLSPRPAFPSTIAVTNGQLQYELGHLLAKLELRAPVDYAQALRRQKIIEPHPCFTVIDGPPATWEKRL